jgi:hypothetical protein
MMLLFEKNLKPFQLSVQDLEIIEQIFVSKKQKNGKNIFGMVSFCHEYRIKNPRCS